MHMADALLTPLVGGAFWVVSGALIGYSAKKTTQENDSSKTPLMGVLGAFIFAAQMINFTIPGTGSSGHLGGGLLLAALLGPYRAFITLASVLVIQCLFFADGGILALGCNIFNLAFFPAFVIYPLIFKKITLRGKSPILLATACLIAAEVGLLLGAMSVVIQTVASGITELPLRTFAIFMIPIHGAIGIVEGLVTFGVLAFITKVEPALLSGMGGEGRGSGVNAVDLNLTMYDSPLYPLSEYVAGEVGAQNHSPSCPPLRSLRRGAGGEAEINNEKKTNMSLVNNKSTVLESSVDGLGKGREEPVARVGRMRLVILSFVIGALIVGGVFSWYASSKPDGLEWSMSNASGMKEFTRITDKVHSFAASLQQKVAFFPDYSFKSQSEAVKTGAVECQDSHAGKSVSGIIGSLLVLIIVVTVGFFVRGKTVKSQTGT